MTEIPPHGNGRQACIGEAYKPMSNEMKTHLCGCGLQALPQIALPVGGQIRCHFGSISFVCCTGVKHTQICFLLPSTTVCLSQSAAGR